MEIKIQAPLFISKQINEITELRSKNEILESKLDDVYKNITKARFTKQIVNLKKNITYYKLERNIKRIENLEAEVKKIIELFEPVLKTLRESFEGEIEKAKIAHPSLFEEKKLGEKTIKRQKKIIDWKPEDIVFEGSEINLTDEKSERYEEDDFIYDFDSESQEEPVNKTIKRQEKIIIPEQEIKTLKSTRN